MNMKKNNTNMNPEVIERDHTYDYAVAIPNGKLAAERENPDIDTMTKSELFAAALKADCDSRKSQAYFSRECFFVFGVASFFYEQLEKRGWYDEYEAHRKAYEEWEKAAMLRLPEADRLREIYSDTIPKDNDEDDKRKWVGHTWTIPNATAK